MIAELLVFVVAVATFAIVGIVVGMLVAPRLGRMNERMTDPKDEEAGDGVD
jgi:gas vesicle protein